MTSPRPACSATSAIYVGKYKPDWNDKKWGYLGGRTTTQMFNYYNGKPYAVASDGDYQIFVIRKDLWDDPEEQKAFKAKYGYALAPPKTWDQQADMAEFFTPSRRQAARVRPTSARPAWGWINFVTRYTSTGNPVAYYWDDNMKPLINGPGGLKALNHMIKTTEFGVAGRAQQVWPEQYQNWGDGGAAMTIAFSNLTKFHKKGGPFDKSGFDVGSKTHAIPMPGWKVNGKLVRHTSLYFNASNGVNKFSPSKYHEAAYLVPAVGRLGPDLHVAHGQPRRLPGPVQGRVPLRSARAGELHGADGRRARDDAAGRGAVGHVAEGCQPVHPGARHQPLEGALRPAVAAGRPRRGRRLVGPHDGQGRSGRQIKAWRASKAGWPTMADSAKGKV